MAMKELLYRLQPVQIYIVLVLSIVYFLMQLFLSHITHALTLLVDSYHMLCNIVALSGCIMTIKHCKDYDSVRTNGNTNKARHLQSVFGKSSDNNKFIEVNEVEAYQHERSLRNTFGWMRIEILTMLIGGIFLGAFCFSLVVEAVQTLIHIDHQDTMHHPVAVFSLAIGGLILNAFCYLLIGGYAHHQSSFLHITPAGDVVLDQVVDGDGIVRGSRRLSKTKRNECNQINAVTQSTGSSIQIDGSDKSIKLGDAVPQSMQPTHTFSELMRDISSTLFVIICTVIVYFANNENVTKYVDPIISIVSGITLLVLSYPYMKESCLILLQTIPASIDIEVFKADLLKTFDDIVSVHDLHIWQMTSSKYVSTVHILFNNPMVYVNIKDEVVNFFYAQGITIVTIQPEFKTKSTDEKKDSTSLTQCLIGCQSLECAPKTCCSTNDLTSILSDGVDIKKKKPKLPKSQRKSSSLLSLNVTSLSKLRRLTGSTQDIIKKSVSESHVTQMCGDDSCDSQNTSTNVSTTPSTANNLYTIHNSIDELKEKEFHEQCDERSEQRLPSIERLAQTHHIESIEEHEDASLLDRPISIDSKHEMHSVQEKP